ncbi:hypothetical protein C8Q79DRAFT_1105970 [Trametes meyenii]|nr:hypothetical protein C8Q79DRAFT_1105970 [Trametes meyenii]
MDPARQAPARWQPGDLNLSLNVAHGTHLWVSVVPGGVNMLGGCLSVGARTHAGDGNDLSPDSEALELGIAESENASKTPQNVSPSESHTPPNATSSELTGQLAPSEPPRQKTQAQSDLRSAGERLSGRATSESSSITSPPKATSPTKRVTSSPNRPLSCDASGEESSDTEPEVDPIYDAYCLGWSEGHWEGRQQFRLEALSRLEEVVHDEDEEELSLDAVAQHMCSPPPRQILTPPPREPTTISVSLWASPPPVMDICARIWCGKNPDGQQEVFATWYTGLTPYQRTKYAASAGGKSTRTIAAPTTVSGPA